MVYHRSHPYCLRVTRCIELYFRQIEIKCQLNWNVSCEFDWKFIGIVLLCCFQMEAEAGKANLITGFRRDICSYRASVLDKEEACQTVDWKYSLWHKIEVTKPCVGYTDFVKNFLPQQILPTQHCNYKHALPVLDVLFFKMRCYSLSQAVLELAI